ncbi:GAF domain-containing protein, partial [Okeania hirsuta]
MENAELSSDFDSDPYFQLQKPLSLLCLPLISQGHIVGLIYLENNQLRGAFSKERVAVLEMLSSQMAISLENASLYGNLEKKVQDRTEKIEAQREK